MKKGCPQKMPDLAQLCVQTLFFGHLYSIKKAVLKICQILLNCVHKLFLFGLLRSQVRSTVTIKFNFL